MTDSQFLKLSLMEQNSFDTLQALSELRTQWGSASIVVRVLRSGKSYGSNAS
jgi:hypothetical protein